LPAGSDDAYRGFDQGIAPLKASLTPALEDLGRGRRIPLQQADNLRFERIEFARVRSRLAGVEVILGQPVGHCARIELEFLGDLRGVQPLVGMQMSLNFSRFVAL
jgi:hypothetical protein